VPDAHPFSIPPNQSIVDVLLANNSFENQVVGVFWQTPNVSGITNSHIVGNQFSGQGTATTPGAAIVLSGSIAGVVVANNQISVAFPNSKGIYVTGNGTATPDRLSIVGNNLTASTTTGTVGIDEGFALYSVIHGNLVDPYEYGTAYANVSGRITDASFAFATLPSSGITNGSYVYCSDCTGASPCAGGGGGAMAKRINGAWVCN
jgi:hypothetical protein